jgi:MFS family permease
MQAIARGQLVRMVTVAALGYFVDLYDLILFSVVRVESLKDLGIPAEQALAQGVPLINAQMIGMLLGGLLWGVLGDKRGRLSVLYGSILMYSLANIANGFVQTVDQYIILRFIAGVGLAGELGAGVTLVMESMPADKRGWGTTVIATLGVLGAATAAATAEFLPWRHAYLLGGFMGLALLLLRIRIGESGLFEHAKASKVSRGSLLMLFSSPGRVGRLLAITAVGLPIWYTIAIPVTFSTELGKALGMEVAPQASQAILFNYLGLAVGDLACGALSQWWRSRRKVLSLFVAATVGSVALYFASAPVSLTAFYAICFVIGISAGYWAMFVTVASEQFGTNLRATVTTSVPNFVRGGVVPMTLSLKWLMETRPVTEAAIIVGVAVVLLALVGLLTVEETFGKSLDFHEE